MIIINPITSTMSKKSEKTKSNIYFKRYMVYLVILIKMVFGLKKILKTCKELFLQTKPDGLKLLNVFLLFHLDKFSNLLKKFLLKNYI